MTYILFIFTWWTLCIRFALVRGGSPQGHTGSDLRADAKPFSPTSPTLSDRYERTSKLRSPSRDRRESQQGQESKSDFQGLRTQQVSSSSTGREISPPKDQSSRSEPQAGIVRQGAPSSSGSIKLETPSSIHSFTSQLQGLSLTEGRPLSPRRSNSSPKAGSSSSQPLPLVAVQEPPPYKRRPRPRRKGPSPPESFTEDTTEHDFSVPKSTLPMNAPATLEFIGKVHKEVEFANYRAHRRSHLRRQRNL